MRNTELQARLDALTSIGLDVVNKTVEDVQTYIRDLENAPQPASDSGRLVQLEAQLSSASSAMVKYQNALNALRDSDVPGKDVALAFFA